MTTRWMCLAALLIGCPGPGGDGDGGPFVTDMDVADMPQTDAQVTDDGMIDDGVTDMIVDAEPTDGTPLDGAPDDLGPPDQGVDMAPVDLCADVVCDPGEACDPNTAECVAVGEPAAGQASSGCRSDDDCDVGTCNTALPDGFCQVECDGAARCDSVDLTCAVLEDIGGGAPRRICVDECAHSGCRDGWICVPDAEGSFCLPSCVESGCGQTSYCDAATGICEPFAGPAIAEGAPCNARDDRCDAALACLPDDDTGNGACRALCVPGDAPCPDRDLCAPLFDVPDGEPEIGICVPDAGCDPLDPEAVCGPDRACAAAPPITVCVDTGPQPLDAPCNADRLCQPGLTCHYGRCLQPCANDDVCGGDTVCLDYGGRVGQAFGVCYQNCNPLNQAGCPPDARCALIDVVEEQPIGQCADALIREARTGDPCRADETYNGNCSFDNYCDVQSATPTCRALCRPEQADDCADQICAMGVFDAPFDGLGICLGGCNVIGADAGCPGAIPLKCAFTGLVGVHARGADVLVGECTPFLPGERAATGETCVSDAETGADNCANGNICAVVDPGGQAECVQLCEPPRGIGRDPCVTPGRSCIPGIFGGSDRFGACLP